MRTVGIIAEYNPFHNGHARHIALTREKTDCRYIVVVMGGAFTQRGDAALVDKWARVDMALAAGADVVLELPALFAVRPAERFAAGGVGLLSALGVVDGLSFGCETGDLADLMRMALALEREPESLSRDIRQGLNQGMSYARARGEALARYVGVPPEAVNAPNTALALEYLRANARLDRPLSLCAIERNSDYNGTELSGFASAAAVRRALLESGPNAVAGSVPETSLSILTAAYPDALADPSALDNLLLYRLRGLEETQIARLPEVAEGLEASVKREAHVCASRAELLAALKSKRYTMARLKRVCAQALLGFDRGLAEDYPFPTYARLLGFRSGAKPLLRELSAESAIPLASDPTRLIGDPCFELERRATDLWGLCARRDALRRAGRDLTEKMRVFREEA